MNAAQAAERSDRAELERLVGELGILSAKVREELELEPERAVRVLREAIARPGLRSPASYAIARFRRGAYAEPERAELTVEELAAGLEWARANGAPATILQACTLAVELGEYHAERGEAREGSASP